jgi:ribosomal protein S18 acetylase RimI-like enzyme
MAGLRAEVRLSLCTERSLRDGRLGAQMFILRVPMMIQVLERFGLLCRLRAGMTLDLRRLAPHPALPDGYALAPWDYSRLKEVAQVDYLAYRDSLDSRLYWQYFSSAQGCERMWREAIAGKFGRFDPERTLLLVREGRVCGDVMASMRSPREGFIGNLAVSPEHRGGTGTALLLNSLWRYRNAGFDRVSLAVTLENERAYHLYARLGFVVSGRFPLITRPARAPHLSNDGQRVDPQPFE